MFFFQAIVIDSGHDRPFIGLGCFALDERRQGNYGKQGMEARGNSGAGLSGLICLMASRNFAPSCALNRRRRMARKRVGCGEEKSFECGGLRRKIAD